MADRRSRWPLTDVQILASEDRLALTRTVYDLFFTREEAVRWIREVIVDLRLADFAHTAELDVHVADVYGFLVGDHGWYLKLTVAEDGDGSSVLVISGHPLERPLKTRGGWIQL